MRTRILAGWFLLCALAVFGSDSPILRHFGTTNDWPIVSSSLTNQLVHTNILAGLTNALRHTNNLIGIQPTNANLTDWGAIATNILGTISGSTDTNTIQGWDTGVSNGVMSYAGAQYALRTNPFTWGTLTVTGIVDYVTAFFVPGGNPTNTVTIDEIGNLTLKNGTIYGNGSGLSNITASTTNADTWGSMVSVKWFGAVGDGVTLTNCWIESGSANLICSNANWTQADSNKYIRVIGAGSGGNTYDLAARITNVVNGSNCILNALAGTTVQGKPAIYGTDDTAAVQSCFDQITNDNLTVFFPKGIYCIAGAPQSVGTKNAQLILPNIAVTTESMWGRVLRIVGDGASMQGYGSSKNVKPYGSTICSLIVGTGGSCSLFNPMNDASDYVSFNNMRVVIEKMNFRCAVNPQMTALDLSYAMNADLTDVGIETGVNSTFSPPQPTCSTSYGLKMPTTSSFGSGVNQIDKVYTFGYYTGYLLLEHDTVVEACALYHIVGVEFGQTYHSVVLLDMNVEWCKSIIKVSGACYPKIERLDIEHAAGGWYVTTNDFHDPSSLAQGQLHYCVTLANSGHVSTFTKTGGTNMLCVDFGFPDATVIPGAGVVISSNCGAFTASIDTNWLKQFLVDNISNLTTAASVAVNPTNLTCLTNTTANFYCVGAGTPTIGYFWYTNDVLVSGATTTNLQLANVVIGLSNASVFCIVSNTYGTATSTVATLTITNGVGGGVASPTSFGTPVFFVQADNAQTNTSGYITNAVDTYGLNNFHLTNSASGKMPSFLANGIGTKPAMSFDGANDFLQCASYICVQPHEVWILLRLGEQTSNWRWIFGNNVTGAKNDIYVTSGDVLNTTAGNEVGLGTLTTNVWRLYGVVFNGANSRTYTNGVLVASGNEGTGNITNLFVGSVDGTAWFKKMDVAAVWSYSATNTPENIANIWMWTTNTYGPTNF